jgi:hypothetical protein
MRLLTLLVVLLLAAGCASVNKIESGERKIGDRLVIQLDGAWNHVDFPNMGPAQTWTMEGLPVDQLLLYSGLKDGEAAHATTSGGQKSFAFRASMQPDEIVSMFEGMLTRDGSTFKLGKLEPAAFGEKGFRFEYTVTRKVDNVQLAGVGYGSVSKGQLFAMLYQAPRLTFFSRHQQRVEQMARTARLGL